MQRSRSRRVWGLATVLVVVAVASTVVVWRTMQAKGFGRPFKVLKMSSEPGGELSRSEMSEPVTSDRALAVHQSSDEPARPVRRIDGATFVDNVEKMSPLSAGQRTRLMYTFQVAAKLQTTIDATDNPDTRADLQRRLDEQVRTRLRLTLPKQALAIMSEVDEGVGPVAFDLR